jgi:branched-chain amino acid transport system ATP-binding protein
MNSPLLKVDSIRTAYDTQTILHDVTLEVKRDEVVALLGRNGAGKTTTLRSITGVVPPFAGSIRFKDQELTRLEAYQIASQGIRLIPEERRLFSKLTVDEHIKMVTDSSVRSLAEEYERVYDIFPDLGDLRDFQAENLSGGQQQMLAVARALVGRTELLLMDEPTEGLAPKIIETILETIESLSSDLTILLVEQNYEVTKRVADRYYILDQGEVVSKGPMEKLTTDEELRDTYLGVT